MAYRAKLFANGRSQAVRLPKEYAFSGDTVLVKKVDGVVMLFPEDEPWKPFLASLDQFTSDFLAEGRTQQPPQDREALS